MTSDLIKMGGINIRYFQGWNGFLKALVAKNMQEKNQTCVCWYVRQFFARVTIWHHEALAEPRDAKQWLSGQNCLSYPQAQNRFFYSAGLFGLFKCNRMAFELTNASTTFQGLMGRCMGDLHFKKSLIYLDDIIIFSKTFNEHIQSLEHLLTAWTT